MAIPVAKSFRAALERVNSPLKWVIIRIPFDVYKLWGTRGVLRVKGEINGFAFRTSLFPPGKDGHFMPVNKRMQAGAGAVPGAIAQFRLEPDTEERVVTVPGELKRILAEHRPLRRWFDRLNYSMRKEIGDWIRQVKSAEARVRRAQQIAERLLATMEAEHDPLPILQVAFARDPRALEGWKRMSLTHRRRHLLAIFYNRSPEARARRLAKTILDAVEFAERSKKRKDGRGQSI